MPDLVQTIEHDPTSRGIVRGMTAKWATKHDFQYMGLRFLWTYPLAVLGTFLSTYLLLQGVPLLAAVSVGALPQLAKSYWTVPGLIKGWGLGTAWETIRYQGKVKRGWVKGTKRINFTGKLYDWEVTQSGVAAWVNVGKTAWTPEELEKGSRIIASAIKGCRSVTVTEGEFPSIALVEFAFSDPLAVDIPITDLPAPAKGRLSAGITEHAEPISLLNYQNTLVVGQQGSGKSNLLWTLVASALQSKEPFKLWALDPSGGTELFELIGSPIVTEYAAEPHEMRQLVQHLHTEMMRRAKVMAGRERMLTPTEDTPRIYLVVDELIRLMNNLKGEKGEPNYNQLWVEILSMGRKYGITTIALTQIPFGHTIGEQTRVLFPQKVVLRANDFMVTGAAFGPGAEALGIAASRISINTPGIGYMIADDGERPVRFRAPLITDEWTRILAQGVLPDQIPRAQAVDLQDKEHILYKWENPNRVPSLRYIGISVDGMQRANQHLANVAKEEFHEPGVTMTILQRFTDPEGEKSVRQLALDEEERLIREHRPPLNKIHNPDWHGHSQ